MTTTMILQRGYNKQGRYDIEEDTTTAESCGPYNSTIKYKRRDTTTAEDTKVVAVEQYTIG